MKLDWLRKKPNVDKLLKKNDIEGLIVALKDHDKRIRISAAQALGKTFDWRAAKPLEEALEDANVQVRQSAADSLGKIGVRRSFAALEKLLKDANGEVRKTAKEARKKILEQNPNLKTEEKKKKVRPPPSKKVYSYGKYAAKFSKDSFKNPFEKQVFDPTICVLCGKKRSEKELRSWGEKERKRSFCLDTCWSKRGKIIGSKLYSAQQ